MGLKVDSRQIKNGDTFLALGINGHKYVTKAISNGANCVIVEQGTYSVTTITVTDTRAYLETYLDSLYKDKLQSLKLIAMTGTNGKTTTCYLIHKALNKLGKKCGYIGTIGFYIDTKIRSMDNTTPDLFLLYELLLECVAQGCTHVVMEVSSQALDMGRIGKLTYDYCLFSNLSNEHLDYHKTITNYALAKQKLFYHLKENGKAIVNSDDKYSHYFTLPNNNNILYGFNSKTYKIEIVKMDINGTTIKLNDNQFDCKLIGRHNIYNIVCVIILLHLEGINTTDINECIKLLNCPTGRMEVINHLSNKIIIDYAHTPDAVLNIIKTVRELNPNRIIVVIGCGGNRDHIKRPIMGKLATLLADEVIFTSDNPRDERPEDIISDMTTNLTTKNYKIEINRSKAIIMGIQILKENDILLLLGKGHENYQIVKGNKFFFDDKKVVLDNIRR